MIVIDEPAGTLLCVRQPDHATTCAAMAQHWRWEGLLPAAMWPRVLTSLRVHDDWWKGVEDLLSLDAQGRPMDFLSMPTRLHVDIWRRSIELAANDDA